MPTTKLNRLLMSKLLLQQFLFIPISTLPTYETVLRFFVCHHRLHLVLTQQSQTFVFLRCQLNRFVAGFLVKNSFLCLDSLSWGFCFERLGKERLCCKRCIPSNHEEHRRSLGSKCYMPAKLACNSTWEKFCPRFIVYLRWRGTSERCMCWRWWITVRLMFFSILRLRDVSFNYF